MKLRVKKKAYDGENKQNKQNVSKQTNEHI